MLKLHQTQRAVYSAQQMYYLINDVAAYATFLPGCIASWVVHANRTQTTAALEWEQMGMRHRIVTQNRLFPYQQVQMQLVEGPFVALDGYWRFSARGEAACDIDLVVHLSLQYSWMESLAHPLCKKKMAWLLTIFMQRAEVVYGGQNNG